MKDLSTQQWTWEPFEYICEGFDGQTERVGGFWPADVRERCSFTIYQIHGPVVNGFWSWCMKQLVDAGNK